MKGLRSAACGYSRQTNQRESSRLPDRGDAYVSTLPLRSRKFKVGGPLAYHLTGANGGVEAGLAGRRYEGLSGQYFLIPEAA